VGKKKRTVIPRTGFDYSRLGWTEFLEALFVVNSAGLAERLSAGTAGYVEKLDYFSGVFGQDLNLRNHILNLERVSHQSFKAALHHVNPPSRVKARHEGKGGCQGLLYLNRLSTGCNNKVCPQCYNSTLIRLHDRLSLAMKAGHKLVTANLINVVARDKVEQEFTQASMKSMADPYSAIAPLCRYSARVPHVTELGGKPAVGYAILSIVPDDRIQEFFDAFETHQRYDIRTPIVFEDCSGSYLLSCFKYPWSLMYPEYAETLQQFLQYSNKARTKI